MNVAWALFWGGSRSTKPCVLPCEVAAGGDERYLLCAPGAAAVGLIAFFCRAVTVASSCFGCACACVVIGYFGICGCRLQWNGYMIAVIWCCETHCSGCAKVAWRRGCVRNTTVNTDGTVFPFCLTCVAITGLGLKWPRNRPNCARPQSANVTCLTQGICSSLINVVFHS